jgi:hypothetical protein
VHGILVQLPLPKSMHTETVINAIDPAKDVDGCIRTMPAGWPAACRAVAMHAARLHHPDQERARLAEGMNAIVIGRSNLVGRPLVQLLLNENATVTIAHSRSKDLRNSAPAPIWSMPAVGKPEMVRAGWIKPGATVIDVGINRTPLPDGKTRLVGDVAFMEVAVGRRRDHAGARRRRPDDGGVPAGQYAARGLRDPRPAEACGCEAAQLSLRHCERSEAIHLTPRGKMDCFVASLLAMTEGNPSICPSPARCLR